ncbi:hypothetical protein CAC42_3185 [Sphaceloma murrayae]|uniref:Rhodopsin domain-containing protein n=1 Tax=Sphaceloma murrayae TaxID=2082308 RepID=A0A2K1QS77_9PEZI|nr:hypothetical protein CAC42_3185 [Sphaceloma murrayae]
MVASGYGGEGPVLMAVGWTECTLGVITIGLRLYGASKRAGQIRWDFLWIALAGVFGLASQATFAVANWYGMGNHMRNLTYPQIVLSLKWVWISIFLGLIGLTFAKWAIIALLLQVQLPTQVKRRIFLWSLAVLLGGVCIVQFVLSFTQCVPAARLWNPRMPGVCPGATRALYFGFFQGASGVAIDVILALYPISIVWNLQASLKMKIGFCLLMAGGIIPAAAGTVKAIMLDFLRKPNDITYEFAPFMTWAATELWLIIILGSIPPLRPLFVRLFRKAASTLGSVSASRGPGTIGRTAGSVPLQSMTKSAQNHTANEKKSNVNTYTSNVMSNLDDSEEDMLRSNGANMGQIVMTHEYAVESAKRQSTGGTRPSDLDIVQDEDHRTHYPYSSRYTP